RRDRMDERESELMTYIVEGSQRMQRMIDDLLEYTRIVNSVSESPDLSSNVKIESALTGAIENIRGSIEESAVKITWDRSLPTVSGSPLQIQQVFQNLLSNAIKYAGVDPQVHVSSRPDGDLQVITVSDNGIGIEMKYANQIFEAFTRLNSNGTS